MNNDNVSHFPIPKKITINKRIKERYRLMGQTLALMPEQRALELSQRLIKIIDSHFYNEMRQERLKMSQLFKDDHKHMFNSIKRSLRERGWINQHPYQELIELQLDETIECRLFGKVIATFPEHIAWNILNSINSVFKEYEYNDLLQAFYTEKSAYHSHKYQQEIQYLYLLSEGKIGLYMQDNEVLDYHNVRNKKYCDLRVPPMNKTPITDEDRRIHYLANIPMGAINKGII